MTQQLTLKPIIKDMLERAGIEDVYDFAPSAKNCACPIVIVNETYERTDLLDDCEYGTVKLEVIAVRETRDEALSVIGGVIYALHQEDWERWSNEILKIRTIDVNGLPKEISHDESGRSLENIILNIEIALQQ